MPSASWMPFFVLAAMSCARAEAPSARSAPQNEQPHPHAEHPSHAGQHAAGAPHDGAHAEHDLPPTPATADHRFTEPERWSKVFDDPARDAWQKPAELVRELGLSASAVVVDLGAGTGYFVSHLSRAVPRGRVVAVDVEPEMVSFIEQRVRREQLRNVVPQLAAPDDPKLDAPVDLVLVVDTYHHISDRIRYFARVREKLRAGGRVVVVDFRLGKRPVGPPEGHKLAPAQVEREMGLAGYAVCRRWEGLPHQYVLFFGVGC